MKEPRTSFFPLVFPSASGSEKNPGTGIGIGIGIGDWGTESFRKKILEKILTREAKKPGPKPRGLSNLRLTSVKVKVFFTQAELAELDQRRQQHARGAFLRAAGLSAELAAPLSNEYITTWSSSARLASCLTQINLIATELNSLKLAGGALAAAQALQKQVPEVSQVLAEFRSHLVDANPSRSKKTLPK